MSALGLLNFAMLQWFGVRLARQDIWSGYDAAGYPHHSWHLLRWVWPLTGWWSDYRWIKRVWPAAPILRERRYHPEVWCPECGALPECDEDRCCVQCGATCGAVPDVVAMRTDNQTLRDVVELLDDARIAAAVAAETKRCALIAEANIAAGPEAETERCLDHRVGRNVSARHIAAAIRATPEGS